MHVVTHGPAGRRATLGRCLVVLSIAVPNRSLPIFLVLLGAGPCEAGAVLGGLRLLAGHQAEVFRLVDRADDGLLLRLLLLLLLDFARGLGGVDRRGSSSSGVLELGDVLLVLLCREVVPLDELLRVHARSRWQH